jgi:hypothetical protein
MPSARRGAKVGSWGAGLEVIGLCHAGTEVRVASGRRGVCRAGMPLVGRDEHERRERDGNGERHG